MSPASTGHSPSTRSVIVVTKETPTTVTRRKEIKMSRQYLAPISTLGVGPRGHGVLSQGAGRPSRPANRKQAGQAQLGDPGDRISHARLEADGTLTIIASDG